MSTCIVKHHALLYRATWWQLGLNSKEDLCFTVPIAGLSAGGAGPSQTPSIAIWRCRLHVGTSVLIGGGPLQISEKYSRGRWHK